MCELPVGVNISRTVAVLNYENRSNNTKIVNTECIKNRLVPWNIWFLTVFGVFGFRGGRYIDWLTVWMKELAIRTKISKCSLKIHVTSVEYNTNKSNTIAITLPQTHRIDYRRNKNGSKCNFTSQLIHRYKKPNEYFLRVSKRFRHY